ncbi:ChbG/HpnK family deacetylase [Sporomusa acidovorans]|uniref:Carbohydrate deacetylase n=1 Tax=Sporomusa acidovorans (strain ATCC 49682 / DSM 3132 / Mol) TaxID=1123286 RepID=A0ABZ3J0Z7_SPOA4|nr:ChbG/HpnK family deacetylase [Sporomusa acidovorans]OZC15047.1 hypothetical protein SPACI_51620 [Sporomusa acidovorans DSM 3132]SDE84619.1 hopanoid biosynthesis associated protein HpnK [Sporomusa acidovorans]
MKQLIVNADDFGLHESINHGIIEGYTKGCITSTSLMAGGPAFEHAAGLAAKHPQLGIGVHLTLVGGLPVSEPHCISSLVDGNGMFCGSYASLFRKIGTSGICLRDVQCELTAQVEKVLAAGINVTHLDSHQHMHVVPGIFDVVLRIAKKYHIPAMRIPAEPLLFLGGFKPTAGRIIGRTGLSVLANLAHFRARRAGIVVPDHFYGMVAGGSMDESLLLNIIDNLPEGVSEVMVHPGFDDTKLNAAFSWGYHWQQELSALTSGQVAKLLEYRGIRLVSFAQLITK